MAEKRSAAEAGLPDRDELPDELTPDEIARMLEENEAMQVEEMT